MTEVWQDEAIKRGFKTQSEYSEYRLTLKHILLNRGVVFDKNANTIDIEKLIKTTPLLHDTIKIYGDEKGYGNEKNRYGTI